jgi:hypothetical protein
MLHAAQRIAFALLALTETRLAKNPVSDMAFPLSDVNN